MTFRNRVLRLTVLPAAMFVLAAVTPASSQPWDPGVPPVGYGGRIHPQHIEAMVRSMGFQPVADPRPRGPLWVTHAVDRNGQHVRVLIDSFSGRVIDVLRRPVPPQNVNYAPPPNFPPAAPDARVPNYTPQANAPRSDYEDDGPDYDYRDMPRQRPQDWPPSRPQTQQQGPNVIPYEPRSDNNRLPNPPKTNTVKKKDAQKNDTTAALTPEKDKQKIPAPKARPEDAPKSDAQKKDAPKADPQKTVQTPKMPATDTQRAADPQATGTVNQAVPTFDAPKKDAPLKGLPPVQPPF